MNLKERIIGDKFEAALWAASLLLVILFQGIITSYAQASMVAWANGPVPVICSIHDADNASDDVPFKDFARSCCSTLCQAACAVGGGIAVQTFALAYDALFIATQHPLRAAVQGPPDYLVEIHFPRGPPSFPAHV